MRMDLAIRFRNNLLPSLRYIMRNNLNLNRHPLLPQPRNTNTRPKRPMIRHVLFKILHHGFQPFLRHFGHVVRRYPEDLRPASFRACVAQGQLDVCEGLCGFLREVRGDVARGGVPAS